VLPRVPLAACLERWAAEQTIEDYQSAAAGHRTRATRRTRLASFPPFLLVQLQRCAPLCALACLRRSARRCGRLPAVPGSPRMGLAPGASPAGRRGAD